MTRLILPLFALVLFRGAMAAELPNIVWISSEDHGPHLGCYGDEYATTPNLDRFAEKSLRYTRASSNAPVCAPARTTIISGMYPASLGAQHMRCRVPAPEWLRFFPKLLQEAGYYTSNNSKEDYNLIVADKGWDDSSNTAHWKNRPEGKPFFSVFNFFRTHESQIRNENEYPQHDPSLAPLPPYHPDTPEVRKDWAQYYDRLSLLDRYFQERLDELEAAGLLENTIVFFWADHGSGMPRSKRYPGWSGLHVPLMVYVPEQYKELAPDSYAAGAVSDRLVSFVDFAPTVLSIAGIEAESYHQGGAFMGSYAAAAPDYSFGFRGRMDERMDSCRSVTDGRYMYIRSQYATLPHGQYLEYQQQTRTTSQWRELYLAGELDAVQSAFWEPQPREELYDLEADPHETVNLGGTKKGKAALKRLRAALDAKLRETRDLGFVPEPLLRKAILDGRSPAEAFADRFVGGADPGAAALAEVNFGSDKWIREFGTVSVERRYWMLVRLWERGGVLEGKALELVRAAMADEEGLVRVAAAECLAQLGREETLRGGALDTLVELARYPENELILSLYALNALDRAREAGMRLPDEAGELVAEEASIPQWASSYRSAILKRF